MNEENIDKLKYTKYFKHKPMFITSKALRVISKTGKSMERHKKISVSEVKFQLSNNVQFQKFDNFMKQTQQIRIRPAIQNQNYSFEGFLLKNKINQMDIQEKNRMQDAYILDQKQIRSVQINQTEIKMKTPNIINMEFGLNHGKSPKIQQKINKKNNNINPNNNTQKILVENKDAQRDQIQIQFISQAQKIYDFKQLDKARYKRDQKFKKFKNQMRNSTKVQLSPIKKTQIQLNNYMKSQCLNVRKIKQPEKKKKQYQMKLIGRILQIQKKQYQSNQEKLVQFESIKESEQKTYDIVTRTKSQEKKRQYAPQYNLTKRNHNKKDFFVFGLSQRIFPENKIQYYRDFLWKINMSNSLFLEPEVQLQRNYKIYIGHGNNSMLIKGLIKRRFWWTIVDKLTDDVNFVWTQLKLNDFIKLQKNYNQQKIKSAKQITLNTTVETDYELNNKIIKKQKINNKKNKHKKEQIISNLHENIFSPIDMELWNNYFENNKQFQQNLNQKVYSKRAILLKNKNAVKIQSSENLKLHNHFNSNFFIGNKKAMFYSLRKYYQLNNKNVFEILPLTFHITKNIEDLEYLKFQKVYNEIHQNRIKDKSIKNIWIVKPGEFTNRGTGITVCASLDDIKIRLKGKQKNLNGKYRTFIVQKYIEKPLLYHKRKFDIRHYMMITCINGIFKGYWYQQGYIRTTSYQYNIKNCKDNLIHLTNDAIQKNTEQYGKYEKGNKISYAQFQKYLNVHHKDFNFFETILPKMKKICAQAIKASYLLLDPDRKYHNFQIFGMDFMIDQQFHPWLIEINTNPCLQLSCPLLGRIIPNFVENAFKIGLDPLFQPPYNWPSNRKYTLGENPLQSNKFSIIFDEANEGNEIQELYKNVQKVDKNMGQIEQEDEQFEDQGKQWNEQI